MADVSLQALFEAGCHFGHKSERWHPKAAKFIYAEKDGIHIIDLTKTKDGLDAASKYITELVSTGKEIVFIATKRQAKAIVEMESKRVGAPYMAERWIGGFLTNWEGIHKNIQKINRMTEEEATGAWKKFPKHEQIKMARYLARIKSFYGGVLTLNTPPAAMFVIDVKKEIAAVREGTKLEMPIVAVVDTNADPSPITYAIPSNDDAVGAISILMTAVADAYQAGKEAFKRSLPEVTADKKPEQKEVKKTVKSEEEKIREATDEVITGQDVKLSTEDAAVAVPASDVPAPAADPAVVAAPVKAKKPAAKKAKVEKTEAK
jgi:small subunit ribosomal protein S2